MHTQISIDSSATVAKPVFAFAARVANAPEWGETIYNTTSAGRAKREHHLAVSEPWPDVKFTDIRVHKLGAPHTSEAFLRNAAYRGLPHARCGHQVELALAHGKIARGTIVGHNGSANFDVLFDEGTVLGGLRLNVHPAELRALTA
jgi:hypothetical protein